MLPPSLTSINVVCAGTISETFIPFLASPLLFCISIEYVIISPDETVSPS